MFLHTEDVLINICIHVGNLEIRKKTEREYRPMEMLMATTIKTGNDDNHHSWKNLRERIQFLNLLSSAQGEGKPKFDPIIL